MGPKTRQLHKTQKVYCAKYRLKALDAPARTMLLFTNMKPAAGFYFYAFYFYGTVPTTPLLALE